MGVPIPFILEKKERVSRTIWVRKKRTKLSKQSASWNRKPCCPPKHKYLHQPPSTSLEVHLLSLSQIQVSRHRLLLLVILFCNNFIIQGLFTSLTRRLGIHGLELVEM